MQSAGPDVTATSRRELVVALVYRIEEIVTDRIRNIEVVTHHQALVVMKRVMPSQAIHERQSADPGVWIHVVGKMQ